MKVSWVMHFKESVGLEWNEMEKKTRDGFFFRSLINFSECDAF